MLKSKFGFAFASAIPFALLAASASADVITYDLTTTQLGVAVPPYVGPFVEVDVNRTSSTTANITFKSLTDASGYTYLFRSQQAAGVEVNATSWTVSNIMAFNTLGPPFTGPIPSNGGSGNEDGYGSFNQTISLADGFKGSANDISFILTDTSGTWASASQVLTNNGGQPIAAEIGAYNAALNFGDFTATGFSGDARVIPQGPPLVPEPGSLALLGTGLAALGLIWRRKSA
jgi:hypothetical protein